VTLAAADPWAVVGGVGALVAVFLAAWSLRIQRVQLKASEAARRAEVMRYVQEAREWADGFVDVLRILVDRVPSPIPGVPPAIRYAAAPPIVTDGPEVGIAVRRLGDMVALRDEFHRRGDAKMGSHGGTVVAADFIRAAAAEASQPDRVREARALLEDALAKAMRAVTPQG
jgi:hypothetical protein